MAYALDDENGKRYMEKVWEVRTGLIRTELPQKTGAIQQLFGFFGFDDQQRYLTVEAGQIQGFYEEPGAPAPPACVDIQMQSHDALAGWTLVLGNANVTSLPTIDFVDFQEGAGSLQMQMTTGPLGAFPGTVIFGGPVTAPPLDLSPHANVRLSVKAVGGVPLSIKLYLRDGFFNTEAHPLVQNVNAAWTDYDWPTAGFAIVNLNAIVAAFYEVDFDPAPGAVVTYHADDLKGVC